MTEVDTEEKSEESTSEPEQKENTEESNITDDTESAGAPEENLEKETSKKTETEASKESEEKTPEDENLQSNEINAVTPTEVTIDVKQYEKEGTPATTEDGQATDRELTGDEAAVEVTYIDGTSADDSKALGGDRPVKFFLSMKDGWKADGLAVSYSIPSEVAGQKKEDAPLTAVDGVYTVPTNVDPVAGDDPKPASYSGNITIKIVAVPVKSTVKLSAEATGRTVCLVKTDGTLDTDPNHAITNAAGQNLTYAASTADVTLAVSQADSDAGKYKNITVKIGANGTGKTVYASDTKEVDSKKYDLFTFNPSTLLADDFSKGADNEILVTVGAAEAAHTLTLALDSDRTNKWAAAKVTPTASDGVAYITVNDAGGAFALPGDTDLTEDNYANIGTTQAPKKPVLAFKVTPDAEAMLKLKGDKPVKAVLTTTANATDLTKGVQTLEATAVPESAAGAGDGYYTIDLSGITAANFTNNMTLTITAETEIDSTKSGVHTISFTGSGLNNVALKQKNSGNAFVDLSATYTAKMDDITFGVSPKPGYALKKGTDFSTGSSNTSEKQVVKVSYDKVYALKTKAVEGGAAAKDVTATIAVTNEELVVLDSDDSGLFAATFAFKDSDSYADAAWKTDSTAKFSDGATAAAIDETSITGSAAEYTKENVVVTIETVLENEKTGYVTIASNDADFVVSGKGITKSNDDNYYISEEATLLTLTITSDVEPAVSYNEEADGTADVKAGEAEGTFVAEIPVSELALNDSGYIDDTIEISKGTKTLTVNSKTDDTEDDSFGGEIYVNDKEFTNGNSLTDGMKANVTIVAPTGTELVSVATEVGVNGKKEAVEVGEDKGAVTFEVTMTDAVTVNVALKSVYAATVQVGSEPVESGEDDVYVIPAGSETIKVSLFKGDASVAENAEDILYARIYDGEQIAVTRASSIVANVATINKIDEKDTGVLRVDLASKTTKKVVASVQIKQEKAASELEIKDVKNKKVTVVSVMADGAAAEFTVSAKDGRLDYAADNIGVEVVAKADDTPAPSPVTENDAVKAEYADGKLTITAKPAKEGKEAAAVIRFYDKAKRAAATAPDADKICVMADAITVNVTAPSVVGQKPTVKEAAGTPKTLKVELSTSDKVVAPKSVNKIFYKVTVEGTLGGTLTDADKTQYIEKTAWGKNSQIAEITVNNTVENANDATTLGSAKDYSLKVELVQTTNQTTAPTDAAAWQTAVKAEETAGTLAKGGDKAIAELKKISTRDPLYETKLKMKPASVTVYTRQTLDKVKAPQTQAQFDKKTGYTAVPYVQFVDTKTGVLLGDPSNKANAGGIASYDTDDDGNDIWRATVDANGNVKIGYAGWSTAAKNQPKNMGLKVTAVSPDGAYASSAIVKINVVNGIENIEFVSGDYRTIYKKSGKASLKLSPIFNWGYKDQAPKKKTLTYAMGDAEGKLPGEAGYSLNSELASKVTVNPKNGQVTVDAKYKVGNENTFTVIAKAADYEGNTAKAKVTVEITGQPQILSDVVIAEDLTPNSSDAHSYKVIARDGGTLNAEDFYTRDYSRVTEKNLYVRALKPTAGNKRVYTDDDFVYGVSYATNAKAALSVGTEWGQLQFIKPNKNPVKLTVTPADGSGTKGKKTIQVTLKGFQSLGLETFDSNDKHYDARTLDHTYDGAIGEKFTLMPVAKMWDDSYNDCGGLNYTNVNVTVKGGAKVVRKLGYDDYQGYSMDIVMTSTKATITIADKTEKNNKTVYTITQEPAADAKAKAPGIRLIKNLTAADVTRAQEYGDVELAFQVTSKDKKYTPKNHARQYVLLTPDYTKTKEVNYQPEWNRASNYFLGYNNYAEIIQIDDNGKFKLGFNVYGEETFNIVPGTYTLIATVGTYQEGKFAPEAKGVSVKIKVPGKAAKNSLTVKGSYTLDAGATSPVDLASNKNIVTDYHWTLTNEPSEENAQTGYKNYAMNKIDPKTRKANAFTKYFEVTKVGDSYKLGLKPGLTQADIDYITGSVAETKKAAKADCEGYVTVSSYRWGDTDHEITKDMKITVTFKGAKYTAKTAEASVYENADATVQILGADKAPIALAAAVIATDDKSGATLVTGSNGVEADGKSIKVKFATAGTYKVKFKVLAKDSGYAAMTGATDLKAVAQDKGCAVTATIKVSSKGESTKNKVALNNKVKITSNDFVKAQTATAVNGEYKVVIPVKSAIEGTAIAAAAQAVPATVKDKDYEGKDIVSAAITAATQSESAKVTLTVKRDKLIEANAAKGGKFKFGKTVDVPVTIAFTDSAVTAETVTLKVTLPNPMTFETAVDAAKKLEPVIGDLKDDLLFAEETEMKDDLESRINAMLEGALPKDVQAVVCTRNITLADVAATDKTPAGYKATVTIQKAAAADAKVDYKKEYTFTKAEVLDTTAAQLKTKIEALTAANLEQLGNDYDEAKLLADVKKALTTGENAVKIPVNLSLSVTEKSFRLKKATATNDGKLTATITIRNRNDLSDDVEAKVGGQVGITITKLGTLSTTATAVSAALDEKSGDTGVDYNAIISGALGTGATANVAAVEAALKTAIINAANAAIRNKDIKLVSGKEFKKIEKAADSSNPSTTTDGVDVDFKLPTGSTNGSVSFKLVLTQEGMKDLIVDCTETVTAKTFTAMTVTGKDISGETPEDLTIGDDGKVSLSEVDGAKSLKFEAKVTGAHLTADDQKVTFALVSQATAPSGDDKTLDDIPAADSKTGVTLTTNADGSATLSVAATAQWNDDGKIILYLRASKNLKKLYASDATEIAVADRTKVYTIELTKKAATPAP